MTSDCGDAHKALLNELVSVFDEILLFFSLSLLLPLLEILFISSIGISTSDNPKIYNIIKLLCNLKEIKEIESEFVNSQ